MTAVTDIELEPRVGHGYCCRCNQQVKAVPTDHGFGFEHGSVHDYHVQITWDCIVCGDEVIAG